MLIPQDYMINTSCLDTDGDLFTSFNYIYSMWDGIWKSGLEATFCIEGVLKKLS